MDSAPRKAQRTLAQDDAVGVRPVMTVGRSHVMTSAGAM
jgi:hypothetical protein